MATHSSILAWRIPWTEEPGGLQSTRAHTTEQLSTAQHGVNMLTLNSWFICPPPLYFKAFKRASSRGNSVLLLGDSLLHLTFPFSPGRQTAVTFSRCWGTFLGEAWESIFWFGSQPLSSISPVNESLHSASVHWASVCAVHTRLQFSPAVLLTGRLPTSSVTTFPHSKSSLDWLAPDEISTGLTWTPLPLFRR